MASLADAEEALRSTNAKANFQRLTRLLMCGGLRLLRETFDSIITPADLPVKLSDPAIKTQLKGARLTRPEWDCLYPSTGVYGKSTDFDITLVFRLLRTICGLTPPRGPRGWDNLPNSADQSLEADLVRIKYYRNEVYAHSKMMDISDAKFVGLWKKISEALIRIAAAISREKRDEWKKSIHDFLVNPLTPEEERLIEELDRWYKQDMDVKEMLVEGFNTLTTVTREGHDNIQEDVRCLRQEMQQVEQLSDTVKEEFKTLKGNTENIQEEVRSIRQEMEQCHRPVYIAGSVVIQIQMNITESATRTGLTIRPQLPEAVGSGRMHSPMASPMPIQPDEEHTVGVEDSDFAELQLNRRDPPTDLQMWNVILSFKKSFGLFLQYLGYKLNVFVRSFDLGSLLITVECRSLQVLEGLWEDYRSGHLNAIAQEILVTEEVLEELCLDEVKLKTTISEEEYEKGKQFFRDNSDPQKDFRKMERRLSNVQGQLRGIEQLKHTNWQLLQQLSAKDQQFENLQKQMMDKVSVLSERLRVKEQEINDLKTVSSDEQAQRKHQRHQSPDWAIPRDQIQLTDNVLGRGGWAYVVEGKYCGCAVAVKQIHELILSPYNQNLFVGVTSSIASRCRHPCLLQFIGATNDEKSHLFVTELMESTLRALLDQRFLSEKEVINISLDVARALSYLHQMKPSPIVHCDISSANVLLWRQGDQWRGKVSISTGTSYFMQGRMKICPGSVVYSAPETLTSDQTIKIDVYSFGVLLCEMCIREFPHPERRNEQIKMVTNHKLRALIQKCLQSKPESRPTMEAIIEELEGVV